MVHLLNNHQKGILYATLAGFFYGMVGYFGVTLTNEGFAIAAMLFWRFIVSTIFVTVLIFLRVKKIDEEPKSIFYVFLAGIFFFGIGSNLFFTASQYIGTGLSMVIIFTFPGIVLLVERFIWRKSFAKSTYIALFVMFAGLVLFADIGELAVDSIGIGLSLLGAITFALFFIVNKRINVKSPLVSTLFTSLGGIVCCAIICAFTDNFKLPTTEDEILNIIGIGVVCTALPILLSIDALNYISATKVSALCILEPIFVVVFGVAFLGESIDMIKIIGIIIVLSGTVMITLGKHNKKIAPNSPA
ncbi:MAG: DMT family transporter [Rickettsiales bacterium]